jgi:DNA repair exonuclease SbcCD ATPase subunit
MGKLARLWRKFITALNERLSLPRASSLERELPAARVEAQALPAEIAAFEGGAENTRARERRQQEAFEQRLEQLETERKAREEQQQAAFRRRLEEIESERHAIERQLQELGKSVSVANTRIENAESLVVRLTARLEKEHVEQQEALQQTREVASRQERRLNWAFAIAACALLLGTVGSLIGAWDARNNARLLAELGSDIREIRTAMTQQLGQLPGPLDEQQLSLLEAIRRGEAQGPRPSQPADTDQPE